MILCGLGSMLAALLSSHFVPLYWNPTRIACNSLGVEDLVFSFATGGLMWLAFAGIAGDSVDLDPRPAVFVRRYLGLGLLFVILFKIAHAAGTGPMTAALVGIVFLFLIVAHRAPSLKSFALRGGVVFCVAYMIACGLLLWIWPGFLFEWSHNNLSGLRLWMIPAEEIVWAFAAGASFPLVMAHALDGRASNAFMLPAPGRT